MRTAKVTHEFNGVEDGKIYPRPFKVGEIITGDLARAEVEAGRALWEEDLAKKPPANKAIENAPRNKSSASQPVRASRRKTPN